MDTVFPCFNDANKDYNWINQGISLRDWIAVQAMSSFLRNSEDVTWEVTARSAYMMADEMLAARDLK